MSHAVNPQGARPRARGTSTSIVLACLFPVCLPLMQLLVNQQLRDIPDAQIDPGMPLLWVLRDVLQMTGTKFGCGVAACGACTVLVDGQAARSCVMPVSSAVGRSVQTIEGLGSPERLHVLQRAWIEHQVPQCGYCQSGMLMAAAALLARIPDPTDADIDAAMTNLCRCGTYPRVRAAIKSAAHAQATPAAPPVSPRKPVTGSPG
jgi:isoquinoline 1-oxidoreductase subunit alpha